MKPETVTILANGQHKQVTLPCTVGAFLAGCGWKPTQVVVEHNGKVLSRNELNEVTLAAGDRLEVIVPVAGG